MIRIILQSFAGWFLLLACLSTASNAADLSIGSIRFTRGADADGPAVTFTVSWRNAWKNRRNHDAVWLFVKYRVGANHWWSHARVRSSTISLKSTGDKTRVVAVVPDDRVGFFVELSDPYRGDVALEVSCKLDPEDFQRVRPNQPIAAEVHGVEMVYIPEGPFTLGDPDPAALEFAALFRSGEDGKPDGLYRIESEAAIDVGPAPGQLYHRVPRRVEYEGDQKGPIPAAFPKGFRAFYVMKYEITQGDYATFLNGLSDGATAFRANFAARTYYRYRGTLRFADGRYRADRARRPANFVSWDDGAAFCDWAGLRPMTELEFTKACRGGGEPLPHEFPWGTASKERLARVVAADDDLVTGGEAAESRLSDETRPVLGASFYWVMDLAGSVWERVVTIGHPRGRAFQGTHGDERLTSYGWATNDDWPAGDENAGGFGYRGGGFYHHDQEETAFNPHSPIAYRPYGAWGGGPRYHAYGFRGARTAP